MRSGAGDRLLTTVDALSPAIFGVYGLLSGLYGGIRRLVAPDAGDLVRLGSIGDFRSWGIFPRPYEAIGRVRPG
jgi:hypothetical protein